MTNFKTVMTKASKYRAPEETAYRYKMNGSDSISIFRVFHDETSIVRTFKVGDLAEHDSYNFSYYGKIVKITEKSVTIFDELGNKNKRLCLNTFAWRNYDFDIEVICKRNSEVSEMI